MSADRPRTPLARIGLVCADPLRVIGLQMLLGHGQQFDVTAIDLKAADLAGIELVILDGSSIGPLPALITALRRMRPQLRVLVVGDDRDDRHTEQVIGAGAQGYLTHACTAEELRSAVAVVRDGSIWAPRKVLARLLEHARSGVELADDEKALPTRREREVLRLLTAGRSNREIAASMGVNEGTVKSHLARLMRKAGVTNRTALTIFLLNDGWTSS